MQLEQKANLFIEQRDKITRELQEKENNIEWRKSKLIAEQSQFDQYKKENQTLENL